MLIFGAWVRQGDEANGQKINHSNIILWSGSTSGGSSQQSPLFFSKSRRTERSVKQLGFATNITLHL